ncbi:hypothetical protein EME01_24550 [Sinorhizobium meliloti]|nr:hypothetical protein EME01_24550 [Sinorhizobium meliloti]
MRKGRGDPAFLYCGLLYVPLIRLPAPSPRKRGEGAKGLSGKRQACFAVEFGARRGCVSLLPACGEKVAAAG